MHKFGRRSIGDCSAINRRLVCDVYKTIATSLRSKSVAASLLCMHKRRSATKFDRRPTRDLAATYLKPLCNFCNRSAIVIFFSRGEVASRSQALCDQGLTCKVYTGYRATSTIEHGLSVCTVHINSLKLVDYLSVLRTTMLYLSPVRYRIFCCAWK